ncbi:ELMO/CED-12 family protein [Spironucleus salmonicida]|uniref:ELMO/CED-12 family protein n=1 Tax=Spironucleus salmonicida TaxID=348837 RepID=V6LBM8_9EUKA|nr:ELMO/CED-12 family protein [Spironucleus salmonicida]|eukprot:EST41875.1 ELMO/CED-12 family protein [Spironucleus salmonicida]
MKQTLTYIADVDQYDGAFIYYKNKQETQLFYGAMSQIYFISTDFHPHSHTSNALCTHQYNKFRGFNLYKIPFFLAKKVLKVDIFQISSITPIIAYHQQTQQTQPALLIIIQTQNIILKKLIFNNKLYNEFLTLQVYSASAGKFVKHYLKIFQQLQNIAFDTEKCNTLMEIIVGNMGTLVENFPGSKMNIQKYFQNCVTDSQIWRRIGFQGNRPASDFRASGVLGLLAIVYFSFYDPLFLLNGSYKEEIIQQQEFVNFMDNAEGVYRYPISISIINVTHQVMQPGVVDKLHNCLVNDYIKELEIISENQNVIKKFIMEQENLIYPISQLLGQSEVTSKTNLVNSYVTVVNKLELCQFPIQFCPLRNIYIHGIQLSGMHPQLGGGVFKLISKLVIFIDNQISKNYTNDDVYLCFNTQLNIVIDKVKQALEQSDIIDIDDLLVRISE